MQPLFKLIYVFYYMRYLSHLIQYVNMMPMYATLQLTPILSHMESCNKLPLPYSLKIITLLIKKQSEFIKPTAK